MKPQEAHKILELMAIDMTGALGSMMKSEPMADVLEQRLTAVNEAQKAIQKQIPKEVIFTDYSLQCPTCGFCLPSGAPCCLCGQRLDWTGGES